MPAVTVELEAERVADGNGHLAGLHPFGVAEHHRGQPIGGFRAQHRDIRIGVAPEHARRHTTAIGECKLDGACMLHDVIVREDQAIG